MSDNLNLAMIFDLVDESARDMQKLTSNLNKMKKAMNQNEKEQKELQRQTKKTASVFKKEFNFLNTSLGGFLSVGAITGLVTKGVKTSMQFSDGLAEVATLTDKSAKEIENSLGGVVEGIQRSFGKDQQDVIKALYDGISAGVEPTQAASKSFLESVSQMSIGGRSSMQEAGDLITTVRNAWKDTGITFEQVANSMFGAVREGKTTIRELSANMGQVATIASSAGVSVQETAAAIAALTSSGIRTPEAMTQIKGAIKALIAPAEGAAKEFQKLGINSIGALMDSFKENKLVNTLEYVDKAVKKNTRTGSEYRAQLKKLFPDIEGFNAALALAGKQNDKFNSSLKQTSLDGGQASKAYQKMKTDSLEMAKAQQELEIALKSIGSSLTPYLAQTATYVSGFFDNLRLIIKEAAHIETLKKEEKQKRDIGKEAALSMEKTAFSKLLSGKPMTQEQRAQEFRLTRNILEIKLDTSGGMAADKRTSDQIAIEILPEIKKYIREIGKEESRRKLSGKGALAF